MDKIFEKHSRYYSIYVDDILIFSKINEDHKRHLKEIANEITKHKERKMILET